VHLSFRILLLAGILSFLSFAQAAEPDRPELGGDFQDLDVDTGDTVLRGNASLRVGSLLLRAEQIRYSATNGTAQAQGNVIMDTGPRRVLAEQVTYRLSDGSFRVEKPRVGEYPLYLTGSFAEGTRERMVFNDARATFLEPGPWAPSLVARTLTYDANRNGVVSANQARLGIGPIHPLYLPSFRHGIDVSIKSFLSLAGGYRGNLGLFIEPGVRIPVSSSLRVGADLGFYSRRGVMAGPGLDYSVTGANGERIEGSLHSGFINDHGNRHIDILGEAVPEERGLVTWVHRQGLTPRLRLDGSLTYWSDSEVARDFRRRDFHPVQTPDSFFEAVYAGDNHFLSLFGRFSPNDYHSVQERLPELRFDLLPVPLASGIWQRLQASYAVLRSEEPLSKVRQSSDRADLYYSLTRSFSPREWLSATLVAGTRATRYARTATGSGRGSYGRLLGEFGFDAQLRTSGTFAYRNDRWGINGLRHLFTPKLSYRYIPEAEKGRRYIPQIDDLSFNTYLPQLGLGDIRHLDTLHETNTLRLAFENTLQTRDAKYGSRDLAALTLANDFRFSRQAGERKVSETHIDLALMPVRWLRFELYQRLKPQTLAIGELNTGLTLLDADQWSLNLSTHFLRKDIEEYSTEFSYRLTEAHSVFTRVHYDARRSRFNEQTLGIQQTLGRTWSIRYSVSNYDGPRREGDFEFHVDVRSIGF